MKTLLSLLALALVLSSATARAESGDLGTAKASFNAGAIAYAAGDYLAAIQAFEAAHHVTPLPAIVFSLAQAERRQYFVSHEAQYLTAAVSHFRDYLAQVPTGGRRPDAADALAQLEPLAVGAAAGASPPRAPRADAVTTRLMVTSSTESATVALDGQQPVASPLIVEVAPGPHRVKVTANGFFASEREIVAVSGALVPVEVALLEQPSTLRVRAPADADFYLDGRLVGKSPHAPLSLPSGAHTLGFALNGYRAKTVAVRLGRGETRTLDIALTATRQRTASFIVLATSGVALAAGIGFTVAAVAEENQASRILDETAQRDITVSELDQYEESVRRRDQLRTGATVSFSLSAVALVTGICLHQFDHPNMREAPAVSGRARARPRLRLAAAPTPGPGLAAELSF